MSASTRPSLPGPILNVGVVGGGLVAQAMHLPNLARMPERFALVGLADPSPTVREALGRRHPTLRLHADHRALLEGGVDALVVCTPNATHAEITLDALEAGAHVLVEKPLCITLEDADRIVEATARAHAVVQVGYMKRFDPAVERLLDELPDDTARLRYIDVVTYDPRLARLFAPVSGDDVPARARARLRAAERAQVEAAIGTRDDLAARCFVDVYLGAMVHDVNLVHAALERMGEPVPPTVRDGASWADGSAAVAQLELSSGARWSIAWLLLDELNDFAEQVTLYFTDAVRGLEFPAPYLAQSPTTYTVNGGRDDVQLVRVARSHRECFVSELEHFHDCIVHGAQPRNPPAEARVDLALLTELFLASEHGVRNHAPLRRPVAR